MSDPAEAAAKRAWEKNKMRSFHVQRVVAANEALKPLRDLHYSMNLYLWATTACDRAGHSTSEDVDTGDPVCLTCTENDGGPVKVCAECFDNDGSHVDWPCPTAELIYAAGEL